MLSALIYKKVKKDDYSYLDSKLIEAVAIQEVVTSKLELTVVVLFVEGQLCRIGRLCDTSLSSNSRESN